MVSTTVKNLTTMFKKIFVFVTAFTLLLNSVCESAMARAGGRSSFSGGRSSTSYSNQGSRGSRTYEGGSAGGKNYAPMQRSTTPASNHANKGSTANQQNTQPNQASSFFQRNPMLSTFGAALAGSWLGHMIFGGGGFGGYGGGYGAGAGGGGGFLINLLMMVAGAFAVMMLVRYFTKQSCGTSSFGSSFGSRFGSGAQGNCSTPQGGFGSAPFQAEVVNISLTDADKNTFATLLVEVQNAWSNQDTDHLKKLVTPEMLKYFSDSLSQNVSQGIANKVEDVDVTMVNLAESWRESEMEYATAIIEWSSFDYMVNLNKTPQDADYITEGGNKNLVMTSEAWTFARFGGESGRWILSAIAQVN